MEGRWLSCAILFSYVAIDARIPADHPLRTMKALLEPVLTELAPRVATMAGATPTRTSTAARRSNATHQSVTDPEARLARKGDRKPALVAYTAPASGNSHLATPFDAPDTIDQHAHRFLTW